MRTFALSLASLGLATFALAQDPVERNATASDAIADSYKQFVHDTGGQWVAQWNAATQTPSAIYGTGIRLEDWRTNSLEEGRRQADLVLRRYAAVLGLGTSEFREIIGARMGRTWTFTYDQYFRGLPAIGGRADVRINMKGVVAMLGSVAWQIPADFDVVPAIGEELAVGLAWQALGKDPTGVSQPGDARANRLVIWGDSGATSAAPFYLAWEVPISNVDANGDGPIGRYYVDAKAGKVLHYASDKHSCGFPGCTFGKTGAHTLVDQPAAPPIPTTVTLMAWTRTGIDGQSALVNVPLQGVVLNVSGLGTRTTDANGQFVIDIAAPVTVSTSALDGTHYQPLVGGSGTAINATVNPGANQTIQLLTSGATPEQAAHPSAAYWIDRTNEYCRAILGNSAELATASNVRATVNIASTCNAYYTGNTINFYATGGGCANTAFSTVISHEWGHGLDDRYGGISNSTGDGLSEGWGDILGMYIVDSPMLGSGFQTAGVALRRGDNNLLYPQTGAGVHTAGQVWMGFAWRLRENLRAAFGTPQALAISEDIVISSIAADATNQVDAVREVFIADDDDGNLANGTPHYAQLSAAAIAKNLPYPQLQVAAITHTPLGNTTARLTPRMVNVTAASVGAGTINQVRVHYNTGGGNVFRLMIPNGATDGYRAMLPGIPSGSVSYHFEAVHSSGTTVRLPESGEFSYIVSVPPTGPFIGFYSEGFEAGDGGFTHAQVATQDDWQRGTPAGRSGTSNGVFWADPASAATGSNIFANDLGGTGFNGSYAANVENYLRSPVINCTGRSGVTLRFKRWLTVEEGIYDQATISVNGQLVWANPANGNLVDTSWQTFEIAIPMADNNASVQIEWRLKSDAGLQLGGWNIDDVELGTRFTPPLDAEFRMLPEQAAVNQAITLSVKTQAPATPFLIVVGDTAGPTSLPGVPTLLVGGSYITLPEFTDGTGNYSIVFNAPTSAPLVGLVWYSQVLTLDAGFTTLVTSNQHVNLFHQ